MKLIFLATGGVIGTLLRYGVSELTYKYYSGIFPWATIAVNLTGSFVIGLLWGAMNTDNMAPWVKYLVFIGLLGSFTTFSTFSLDSLNLARFGSLKLAVINILISNICGIGLVILGFLLGQFLSRT